jgi:hypothetical protein
MAARHLVARHGASAQTDRKIAEATLQLVEAARAPPGWQTRAKARQRMKRKTARGCMRVWKHTIERALPAKLENERTSRYSATAALDTAKLLDFIRLRVGSIEFERQAI